MSRMSEKSALYFSVFFLLGVTLTLWSIGKGGVGGKMFKFGIPSRPRIFLRAQIGKKWRFSKIKNYPPYRKIGLVKKFPKI